MATAQNVKAAKRLKLKPFELFCNFLGSFLEKIKSTHLDSVVNKQGAK